MCSHGAYFELANEVLMVPGQIERMSDPEALSTSGFGCRATLSQKMEDGPAFGRINGISKHDDID